MQLLISHTLRRAGHQVIVAENGARGLELFEQHAPDLLIFDANMPVLGGQEAIARLRVQGHLTPAILITAGAPDSSAPTDSNLRFLAKPFAPPRLNAFVTSTLAEFSLQ